MTSDTVVALSSPAGASPRGIVRMSGPDSVPILRKLAADTPPSMRPSGNYFAFDAALRVAEMLLPVRVYVMRAPASYTREDIVEVHAVGAPVVLRTVLGAMLALGARPAQPGEFTRRAFLNGRIDLAQAEAVQRIIHASDEGEMRLAVRALAGGVSKAAERLRERIAALCAEVEAALDFADQDIEIISPAEAARLSRQIAEDARQAASMRHGRVASETPRVALRGPANAGKSSLFNALVAAERAIVAPHPGTTRDTVEAEVFWDGLRVCLVDTAGMRRPEDDVEAEAIARADRAGGEADLVLFVMDAAEDPDPETCAAAQRLPLDRTIVIGNKCDLAEPDGPSRVRQVTSVAPAAEALRTSAATGAGLDELRRRITAQLRTVVDRSASGLALNARHTDALHRAAQALDRAAEACELGLDLAAADLREALSAVGEIAGHVLTDDILDRIFASFCIGK